MKEDTFMTERERMTQGKLYDNMKEGLNKEREKAHGLCLDYNRLYETQVEERNEILRKLLPNSSELIYLQGPIQFDYGFNTKFGKGCYANFNLTVLDVATVTIGDGVLFGPNVSLMTPMHPFLVEERRGYVNEEGNYTDREYAKPIVIGNECWIASNVVICGGVKIGNECIIGAGSVVTRDIPDGYLAAGNPCKPIRKITKEDSVYLKKELL